MEHMLLLLLIILVIKHWLADFPLQTEYMLNKSAKEGWAIPLLDHALVHGFMSTVIFMLFSTWWFGLLIGILDTMLHFIIDRLKGSPTIKEMYEPWLLRTFKTDSNKIFWVTLGLDQALHYLSYILYLYIWLRMFG